jgi:hypothetical protein
MGHKSNGIHKKVTWNCTFHSLIRPGQSTDDVKPIDPTSWIYIVSKRATKSNREGFFLTQPIAIEITDWKQYRVRTRPGSRGVKAYPYRLTLDPDLDQDVFIFSSQKRLPRSRLNDYHGETDVKRKLARLRRRALRVETSKEWSSDFVQANDSWADEKGHTKICVLDFRWYAEYLFSRADNFLRKHKSWLDPARYGSKKRYLGGMVESVVDALPKKERFEWVHELRLKADNAAFDNRAKYFARKASNSHRILVKLLLGKLRSLKKHPHLGNGFPDLREDYAGLFVKPPKLHRKDKRHAEKLAAQWIEWEAHLTSNILESPRAFKLLQKSLRDKGSWWTRFLDGKEVFLMGRAWAGRTKTTLEFLKLLTHARVGGLMRVGRNLNGVKLVKIVQDSFVRISPLELTFELLNSGRVYSAPGFPRDLAALDVRITEVGGAAISAELRVPVRNKASGKKLLRKLGVRDPKAKKITALAKQHERFAHLEGRVAKALIIIEVINLALAADALYKAIKGGNKKKIAKLALSFGDALGGTAASLAVLVAEGSKTAVALKAAGVVGNVLGYAASVWDAWDASSQGDMTLAYGHAASGLGSVALFGASVAGAGTVLGLSALALTGIGLVFVLVGAAVIFFWTDTSDPPLIAWLKACPWGKKKHSNDSIDEQTGQLMRHICSPSISSALSIRKKTLTLRITPRYFEEKKTRFKLERFNISVKAVVGNWLSGEYEIKVAGLNKTLDFTIPGPKAKRRANGTFVLKFRWHPPGQWDELLVEETLRLKVSFRSEWGTSESFEIKRSYGLDHVG